jgi:capsular exopolysaccharide synthesis family protein
MPLLAMLPHLEKCGSSPQAIRANSAIVSPNSRYAEAVQSLRTAIYLSRPGSKPRTILVTSAIPGEGKSMTSMNLAAVFASHNERVLLVDCDMRRGALAKRLGVQTTEGITTVLTGRTTLEDAIRPISGFENLFLLHAGPRPPNPATLVDSPEMAKLLGRCRDLYDVVILDCPPLLGISDTLNFAVFADVIVLVVRSEVTSKKGIQHVRRLMAASNMSILGYVFNDVKQIGMAYGYGYGYQSYYSGYYGEREKENSK